MRQKAPNLLEAAPTLPPVLPKGMLNQKSCEPKWKPMPRAGLIHLLDDFSQCFYIEKHKLRESHSLGQHYYALSNLWTKEKAKQKDVSSKRTGSFLHPASKCKVETSSAPAGISTAQAISSSTSSAKSKRKKCLGHQKVLHPLILGKLKYQKNRHFGDSSHHMLSSDMKG